MMEEIKVVTDNIRGANTEPYHSLTFVGFVTHLLISTMLLTHFLHLCLQVLDYFNF